MAEKIVFEGTVASKVTERLREDIISKKIEAGSRITIKEISERYGVGSMPVREAFRTLEGENLLEINPYKGATVISFDADYARDIYQINCYLEMLITLNAIDTITDEACDRLHEINSKMVELIGKGVKARSTYTALNRKFHNIIIGFNSNRKASMLFYQQQQVVDAMRTAYVHSDRRITRATEQHEAMIAALRSKNRELLREVTESHSQSAMEDFLQQMQSSDQQH